MRNREVANVLTEIADLMEIKGELVFKVVAMRRAAQTIEFMAKDIDEVYKRGELDDIPGVGEAISKKIADYLEHGESKYLKKLKKGLPPGFDKLLELEGVGPKKVKLFYEKLKVKNVKDLEKAVKTGKLRKLPGMREKTEDNILRSIESAKRRTGRMLLADALDTADDVIKELRNASVGKIDVAGSTRRGKETVGDIDILVTSSNPKKVIDKFVRMKDVSHVIGKGSTKASVNLKSGLQVDLRVLKDSEYGSALMYFTGSKDHNVELRRIAISRGMKLSEYGLFKGKRFVAGKTEKEVYRKLGVSYIPPELRENRGELDVTIPKLVEQKDIRGDLHMHTKWTDGNNTIKEMALAAKHLGYDYICISDHYGTMLIANPLDRKKFEAQQKEVEKVRKKVDITILHGAEVDIMANGKLNAPDSLLKKMDFVTASLHTALRKENTGRVISAMQNKYVHSIGHLTGRLINVRQGSDLNFGKIFDKARETETLLEINCQPGRLDLTDTSSKAALQAGCKLVVNTDAHSVEQLSNMKLGISVARRAWARKKDIVNTYNLDRLRKLLK